MHSCGLILFVTNLFLCNSLLGAAAPQEPAGTHAPSIQALFELARERFSGERAMEIVAFMEPHWRLPGNRGFDASIERVADALADAGYVLESKAGPEDRLVYRIERRPLRRPAWEPVDATLHLDDDKKPLLAFESNRNMIVINSFPTGGVVEAELIDVGRGRTADYEGRDVAGKIVIGDASAGRLFRDAVVRRGALGVLAYSIPAYNRAETHPDSIPFTWIPYDSGRAAWAINLSYRARERLRQALAAGPARVRVNIETTFRESDELTLVAEVRGDSAPDERFVLSAHVQEPGANDNASGVACQAEVARVIAQLVQEGRVDPRRTMTFIWGDEISAVNRYLREDPERSRGVRWGLSLDMVGEDTSKTGGTFLIEKMPDPSAVWTRGEDEHTEWGSRPVGLDEMQPHYFNDFVLQRCLEQARATGWVVRTNPYEGGSDHVPFLRAGKPAVLLWHFTDVYYHTDRDRLEMVSAETMKNVGVSTTVIALSLTSANEGTARLVMEETLDAALDRLRAETALSREAIERGLEPDEQRRILTAWRDWYDAALGSVTDMLPGEPPAHLIEAIDAARKRLSEACAAFVDALPEAP